MVAKGEDYEQNLYSKVRNAEYNRQKQEQSVRRLQQQLNELRKKNAATMTKDIAEKHRQEVELEQLLVKEKAELDKVCNLVILSLVRGACVHVCRIYIPQHIKFVLLQDNWCILIHNRCKFPQSLFGDSS